MNPVILPVLGANMTHGVIRAWLKQEGDTVQAGEPLFEVETDKVNAEVEAEIGGVLRKIVAVEGSRVAVLDLVAFIGSADEPLPAPEEWSHLIPVPTATPPEEQPARDQRPQPRAAGVPSGRATASPAARRLARERGIDIERLRGTGARGEITRADVEAAAQQVAEPEGTGRLDESFLAGLRRDAGAFRALSSEMKIDLYRRHGARIGEHVRIESGAVIIAPEIVIGAASSIGADSVIECARFRLGRLSALGKRARVHCRSVEIGDALWAKDDIVIGGGGSGEPGATLEIGDAAFIGEAAYLNPGHPIRLGDEVCLGSRAMLFTHSHWQSVLRGYASLFGPIEVGDHVFIGNQAFLFPGVTVASGATVMVNSFVAVNVAPNTMVGGVPAQVIRHIVAPPLAEQARLFRARLGELADALRERGYSVDVGEHGEETTLDLGREAAVCFAGAWPARLPKRRRVIVLTFAAPPKGSVHDGMTVFDLAASRVSGVQDAQSDEVREFCRRRGIRFRPFAWRFGVGHFEGDRFVARRAEG